MAFSKAAMEHIRANNVQDVLWIAYWKSYLDENPADYQAAFRRTLDELLAAGCRVWLLKETPHFPWDAPKAAAKAAHQGQPVEQVSIPAQSYRDYLATPERGFEWAAERGTKLLEFTPWLEQNGTIPVFRNGGVLFLDETHLSRHGALIIQPVFEPLFSKNIP